MFRTLDISSSGLVAQRLRMDTIAGNIANAHSTQDENGGKSPFQRRMVTLEADARGATQTGSAGVRATVDVDSQTVPRIVHDPSHPHADAEGNVTYPNINIITEFVNALEATRAYEANLSAMQVTKSMIDSTFRVIG